MTWMDMDNRGRGSRNELDDDASNHRRRGLPNQQGSDGTGAAR